MNPCRSPRTSSQLPCQSVAWRAAESWGAARKGAWSCTTRAMTTSVASMVILLLRGRLAGASEGVGRGLRRARVPGRLRLAQQVAGDESTRLRRRDDDLDL